MPRTNWIPLACSAAFLMACSTYSQLPNQALDEPTTPTFADSEVIIITDATKPEVPEIKSLDEPIPMEPTPMESTAMEPDVIETAAMEPVAMKSEPEEKPEDKPEEKRQASLGNVATDAGWVSSEGVELPSFEPIYFDTDSAKLDPNALKSLVEMLVEKPELAVSLKGHSDPRGSDAHNLALAKRRAEAVQQTLLQGGVHPNQLSVESFGSSQPVSHEATEDSWKKNRRVDLQFTAKQDATPKP